jgi:GNAT superfamily N-acetyltransferase
MPIIDLSLVVAGNHDVQQSTTQLVADRLGSALGSPPGHLWVRLHIIPSDRYAENGAEVDVAELPAFIRILHSRPPTGTALAEEAARVCAVVAAALDRDSSRVHVEYAPPGAGRIAFGGKLAPSCQPTEIGYHRPVKSNNSIPTPGASPVSISTHDELPPDANALVDAGLGEFNDQAAPLHEVHPLACLARNAEGRIVGGAIGRWWGRCCELQQLWVAPDARTQGLGTRLMHDFESLAQARGCASIFLETYSLQAPEFYVGLGYVAEYVRHDFPHDIVKYHMIKAITNAELAS